MGWILTAVFFQGQAVQLLPYLVTAAELSFLVLGREREGGAHAGLTAAGAQAVQILPYMVTAAEFPTHYHPSANYKAETNYYTSSTYSSEHYYALECDYQKTVYISSMYLFIYTHDFLCISRYTLVGS